MSSAKQSTETRLRLLKRNTGSRLHEPYHVEGACPLSRGITSGPHRTVTVYYDRKRAEPLQTVDRRMTLYLRDVCGECRKGLGD